MSPAVYQWAVRHGVTMAALQELAGIFGMHGDHALPPEVKGTSEAAVQAAVRLEAARKGVRLFRNNVGVGWAGDAQKIQRDGNLYARRGDVLIRQGRPLHAGLCEGSSDLIGWHTVEIVPEMIGQKIAVFVAIEGKSAVGRLRPAQVTFLDAVAAAGGVSTVARSVDDAVRALAGDA